MSKWIYKLLLGTAIILSHSQTYGTERAKKETVSDHSSSKPRVIQQQDLDALLDAEDKKYEEKKQGFPEKFLPKHLDILLNAPIKEFSRGDAQQIKTERHYFDDLGVYVSLVFRNRDILNAVRAIVQKNFAQYIEQGGKTTDSTAQQLYKAAYRVAESGQKISAYSKIEASFDRLVDSGATYSETATLETAAGNPSKSDRASYRIKIGSKVLSYCMVISNQDQWIPASLIATATYSVSIDEKQTPSEAKDLKPAEKSKAQEVKKQSTGSTETARKASGAGTKASKPAEKQ